MPTHIENNPLHTTRQFLHKYGQFPCVHRGQLTASMMLDNFSMTSKYYQVLYSHKLFLLFQISGLDSSDVGKITNAVRVPSIE